MPNTQHVFFWTGPFSQWYHSNFVLDGIKYNTAEQYMMYHKARLFSNPFNDAIAEQILASTNPKEQKALGRKVRDFDMVWWNENAIQIAFRGNHGKFSQNKNLYNRLMNTGNSLLVEASPFDSIWGVGLNEEDAKKTPPEQWPGKNWLGIVLTDLREHFKNEERIAMENKHAKI